MGQLTPPWSPSTPSAPTTVASPCRSTIPRSAGRPTRSRPTRRSRPRPTQTRGTLRTSARVGDGGPTAVRLAALWRRLCCEGDDRLSHQGEDGSPQSVQDGTNALRNTAQRFLPDSTGRNRPEQGGGAEQADAES